MPLIVQSGFKIPQLSKPFILITSFLARLVFLAFGLYQDKYMKLPYTDIDYFVFTDAAKFVYNNESPYLRETYRYTPLLAWILWPTNYWFEFGKIIFVLCDLITGYLIIKILEKNKKNINMSLIWLWNPMVITISTRGSSESLLTIVIMLLTYNSIYLNVYWAGLFMGLAVHLKIYPFIYAPAILLTIDPKQPLYQPITLKRVQFVLCSALSFALLTAIMYKIYGYEFLYEAYLYHLSRLDHRHNFSIYNLTLYFKSFTNKSSLDLFNRFGIKIEKLAFLPQLLLSLVLIPLKLSKINLVSCFFIQTFAFITFNKVITSQYFIWFLCFLPIFLSTTTISRKKGLVLTLGWCITQGLWLSYAYRLEFLGETGIFTYGLWTSSCWFFIWNSYMLVEFIGDVRLQGERMAVKKDN